MAAVEVLLEAATQDFGELTGFEVAVVLAIGEFIGCCLLAVSQGGRLVDPAPLGAGLGARRPSLVTSLRPYFWLALLSSSGTFLPHLAVRWVQYPVKVVVKSSKLIATMAVSALVGNGRSYQKREYLAALLMCLGAASFSYHAGRTGAPPHLVTIGIILLVLAVVSDVLAVNAQQWVMQRQGVSPMSLMLRQNFVSLLGALSLLALQNPTAVLTKVWHHPITIVYSISVGLVMALAVMANTYLINDAGSVAYVCTGTARKIVGVGLSCILFPKRVTTVQMLGIASVVAGLVIPLRFAKPSREPMTTSSTRVARTQQRAEVAVSQGGLTYVACKASQVVHEEP